jgi:hypothetical protein
MTGVRRAVSSPAARPFVRLGVAVSRSLLIDLLAGEDPAEVDAARDLFVRLAARFSSDERHGASKPGNWHDRRGGGVVWNSGKRGGSPPI